MRGGMESKQETEGGGGEGVGEWKEELRQEGQEDYKTGKGLK